LLDVIPISLLGLLAAIYLTVRLGRSLNPTRVLGVAAALVTVNVLVNTFLIRAIPFDNPNMPVNLSYASLAVVLLIPVVAVLIVTRFRHAGWVAAAVGCFAHAWFCRLADNAGIVNLPMGTHWLWHTYGAATTVFMTEYFYRIGREPLRADPGPDAGPP
ncbi:MAG: hypothetical protein ACRC7O_08885, partial [Fimbriiglobus sp.]